MGEASEVGAGGKTDIAAAKGEASEVGAGGKVGMAAAMGEASEVGAGGFCMVFCGVRWRQRPDVELKSFMERYCGEARVRIGKQALC